MKVHDGLLGNTRAYFTIEAIEPFLLQVNFRPALNVFLSLFDVFKELYVVSYPCSSMSQVLFDCFDEKKRYEQLLGLINIKPYN